MKLTAMIRTALSLAMVTAISGATLLPAMANEGQDATTNAAKPGDSAAGHDKAWAGKKGLYGKHRREGMEHRKEFRKELNLTDDQKARIKAIRESFRNSHKDELDAMKAKRAELRQLHKSGADPQTIAAKRAELKAQRSDSFKADQARMRNDIQAVFTPEQRSKMEARRKEFRQKHPNFGHKKAE